MSAYLELKFVGRFCCKPDSDVVDVVEDGHDWLQEYLVLVAGDADAILLRQRLVGRRLARLGAQLLQALSHVCV